MGGDVWLSEVGAVTQFDLCRSFTSLCLRRVLITWSFAASAV